MSDIFRNVACVVRTTGERTTETCISLLKDAFGQNIRIISEQPFERALQASFQAGIEMAKEWTLVIDADVLCSIPRLSIMLEIAQTLPDKTFMFHASVTDKLFGRYRRAGNRLYATRLLPAALKEIPEQGNSLRPECATCQAMLEKGFRNFKTYHIIGLHDYEQFYRDILRKAALFAFKHKKGHDYLEKVWNTDAGDQDFQAALDAFYTIKTETETVPVSPRILKWLPERILGKWANLEKAPLSPVEYGFGMVDALIVSELAKRGIVPTSNLVPVEY